jgi:hypothetical protein
MDESTFLKRVRAGEMLAIGEYRHSRAEMINWRDKKTGAAMTAPVLRHTVEFGSNSVAVSERVPDSIKRIEDMPPIPFTKGETVILVIEELTKNMGLVSARGGLEKLAPSPAKAGTVGGGQSPRNP